MDLKQPISETLINAMINSYWAIIFWVVFSVFLFIYIQRKTNGKVEIWFEKTSNKKIKASIIAAVLGAIPGCGAAIVMSTLYKNKKISLGMLTATFIATSGDAAFVLLSRSPVLWMKVTMVSIIVGVITGIIVDMIVSHKDAVEEHKSIMIEKHTGKHCKIVDLDEIIRDHDHKLENKFYKLSKIFLISVLFIISIPAIDMIAGSIIFGDEGILVKNNLSFVITIFQVITMGVALLAIFMFLLMRLDDGHAHDHDLIIKEDKRDTIINATKQVIHISMWIMIAVIITETLWWSIGEDTLENFLTANGIWFVFTGIIVAIIPGCGPQIIITELFLKVPGLSPAGLYANYIVQDGDAAFPLLIDNKKTAILLKVINIFPAVIVGLTVYFTNLDFF